jgi:integrase
MRAAVANVRQTPHVKPSNWRCAAVLTLAQFRDWLKSDLQSVGKRSSTVACYMNGMEHAIRTLGADKRISTIREDDAKRVQQGLSKATRTGGAWKPSETSVRTHLIALRCAFNRAVKGRLLESNAFLATELPDAEEKPARIFTPAEEAAIIRAAKTMPHKDSPAVWWIAYLRLSFSTGLRLDEALNLTWEDIDLDGRTVHVRPKKGKGGNMLEWRPKSKKGIRSVPTLTAEAVTALKALRDSSDNPYVFIDAARLAKLSSMNGDGKRHETRPNMLRDFQRIQKRAGISKPGTHHDIRKSWGTRMADHVPMHALCTWMGHADIKTTATYYTQEQAHHAEAARKALDTMAAKAQPVLRLAS